MLYKFKSKASGDIIMLGANGDRILSLIGKEPAEKGIIECADMPAAIQALQTAVAEDDAQRRAATQAPSEAVSLRQRAWPLIEMMKASLGAEVPITWGV